MLTRKLSTLEPANEGGVYLPIEPGNYTIGSEAPHSILKLSEKFWDDDVFFSSFSSEL